MNESINQSTINQLINQSINQSINQYTFNTTVTIAHGYNKFKNTCAKNTVAKDKEKCYM